jgi:hypothetical protein
MGKRVIQECDLTKQEYDPEETVTLVFKKKGKTGRSYDLSPAAATKLEQQLVAGKEAILPEDWQFGGSVSRRERTETAEGGRRRGRTFEDVAGDDVEDDSRFVREKKAELREAGVIHEPEEGQEQTREEPTESVIGEAVGAPKSKDACPHLNKGRIQTTLRGGKRAVYRLCSDCRKRIPEMTTAAKDAFLNGKTDPDVRSRDLTPS